jgi:hypothetical protein
LGWDDWEIGLQTHHVPACWDHAGELPSELYDLHGQASKAESERVNFRYPAVLQKTGLKSQWCIPFQKISPDAGLFPGFETEYVLHQQGSVPSVVSEYSSSGITFRSRHAQRFMTGFEQLQINSIPRHGRSMKNVVVSMDFLEFPVMYTCDGGNHSPRLTLKGLQAASVAVMVFNPFEKSCCSFTPWIIWNIPPVGTIPEDIPAEGIVTAPIPATQGVNDYGTIGYKAPCPSHGQMIRYQFKVYGLDTMLGLDPGSDKRQLINAMKGHVVQFGETAAICSR